MSAKSARKRRRRGKHRKLTPAQQKLVDENLGLMSLMLERMFKATPRVRRMYESEAFGGLVNAAETFDPKLGFKFSTYACKCIWRSIANARESKAALMWESAESLPKSYLRTASQEEDGLAMVEAKDFYKTAMRRLSPEHRKVVRLRMSGESFSAIGDDIGASKFRSRAMYLAAVAQLREEFKEAA